jgi:type II secretory ATPase GspE/PulE/Tfp pilus assembly ATPase PilB-like protein
MGIESFMVTSAVIGVLAQRLVRRNCPDCTTVYEPSTEELEFYRTVGGQGLIFHQGTGCANCAHTGFRGRIGVFEVLPMTDAIKRLLVRDAPHEELRDEAVRGGMTTLRSAGVARIDEGLTTIGEVIRSVHVSEGNLA